MRWLRHLSLLLGLVVIALPAVAHADVNAFTITSFKATYQLGISDPQGTLAINETIDVDFTDYNHGILRALPERYNNAPLKLHVTKVMRDGHNEPYTTYTSNGNDVLKIGDAGSTITGQHEYRIAYDVHNVVSFHSGKPQLNWNVNGTEWGQPFLKVEAVVYQPVDFDKISPSVSCFTGSLGSHKSDCQVTAHGSSTDVTTTTPLRAGETLTLNEALPAGYFRQPNFSDFLHDYGAMIAAAIAVPLLTLAIVYRRWFKFGRDARGRGTIVPEYEAPDGLKPAEVEVILNNRLANRGISSTIIDLAIRKYLKIQESEGGGILGIGKHKQYSFVALPTPTADSLSGYEAEIYAGIFGAAELANMKDLVESLPTITRSMNGAFAKLFKQQSAVSTVDVNSPAAGQVVEMSSLKNKFFTTVNAVKSTIPSSLTARGYFSRNPTTAGVGYYVVGIVLGSISFACIGFNIGLFIGLMLSGLIVIVFAWLAPQRTAKGAIAKDGIEGLKLYLNTAEKDRLKMLQSPDAKYAPQSAEPVKTVELFEKLLPYAMVLGVEQGWAKQFEGLYTTPPDWYSGNWSTFNAVYFASSLNASMSAMNSSFASPASSSSGFSGGAGGGGGGGGGGGW